MRLFIPECSVITTRDVIKLLRTSAGLSVTFSTTTLAVSRVQLANAHLARYRGHQRGTVWLTYGDCRQLIQWTSILYLGTAAASVARFFTNSHGDIEIFTVAFGTHKNRGISFNCISLLICTTLRTRIQLNYGSLFQQILVHYVRSVLCYCCNVMQWLVDL